MPFDLSRRNLFLGLGASLIAAPAIVRAASLMPIRAPRKIIIYSNRVIRSYMDVQAMRDRNVLLSIEENAVSSALWKIDGRSPAMDALADIDEITRRVRLAFENLWPIPAGEWKAQWGEHEINAAL